MRHYLEHFLFILFVLFLSIEFSFCQELLVPELRVVYWQSGVLDSFIYQPCDSGIEDVFICHNGNWPTDGIYCDSINYGSHCSITLKEDWHWTRRFFIRFDTLVTTYDSLSECQLRIYKYSTATNANWIQAYLVTSAWNENTVNWLTAPAVNTTIASDQFTPPFPNWEGWVILNIDTIYENWVSGTNYGLQVRQQDLDSDDGQDFYSSEACIPVDPYFVIPPESSFTSCTDQNIVIDFDNFCAPADSSRIILWVDGTPYTIDSTQLTLIRETSTDTLRFVPSPLFSNGDTVNVVLDSIFTETGMFSPFTPMTHIFFVDILPPLLESVSIAPGDTIGYLMDSICFTVSDDMSGVDISLLNITMNGSPVSFSYSGGTALYDICAPLSSILDSNYVCLHLEDMAQFCGANTADTCWSFYLIEPTIDSVWFWEETDCNDSNIVHICYILSGNSANITISISADSGATLHESGTDWFVTFIDSAGDFGSVAPDTHCFDWIMSTDFPDTEGYDWMVVVSALHPLFADSFSTLDFTLYQINGNDGFVAADSEYFVLTQNTTWRNGRLMTVDTFFCDTLDIEFIFKFVPGWCDVSDDSTGADGISLIFSPLLDPPLSPGGSIGIIGSAGWGVEFDTYNNFCGSPQSDISGNHTAVSIDSVACLFVGTDSVPVSLEQVDIPFDMVDNNWHNVRVIVEYPHCRVILDGVSYIDSDFPDLPAPFWAHIGFSASTGDCYSEHIIDNIVVNNPRIIDTLHSADTAYAPLDSHEPIISIVCPESFIYSAGDSVSIHWSIDDLFWRNDPGTLYIDYDTVHLELSVPDTIAGIEIPATCESISVAVAVRDSFCNWGYDSCSFGICSQFFARLQCPPLDIFTSCQNQTIDFLALDTACHSSIDSVYFTMYIIDSTGDTNSMNLIGPSSNVNFGILGDTIQISIHNIDFFDKDSVAATLDSIRDINGCVSVPVEF